MLASGRSPDSLPTPGELPDELFVVAEDLFGDRLDVAEQYAQALATDAVIRGLIGPREAERIWDRHVLNCAVLAELVPDEAYLVDIGSGAGLPGIPLAIARPDLRVVLLEPLLRRVTFLDEVVDRLRLSDRVEVVRGRAEEAETLFHVKHADVATARAVAPLDRLAGWSLPLVRNGGMLLALKGSTAAEELDQHRGTLTKLGAVDASIVQCGVGRLEEPTTVVRMWRDAPSSLAAGRAQGDVEHPAGRQPNRRRRG